MNAPRWLFRGRGYQHLDAWCLAMEAAESIYRLTGYFPADERYGLTAQLRRAAVSVPSNLAEGNERRSRADRRHFAVQARSSLAEIETQLELAHRFGYVTLEQLRSTIELIDRIGGKVFRLYESLRDQ